MTNQERDLFVKACKLLTVASFYSDKNRQESKVVAEQIQDALIIHASNLLAKHNEAV
jgi:cytochrome c-type biogenesis protein CcmE